MKRWIVFGAVLLVFLIGSLMFTRTFPQKVSFSGRTYALEVAATDESRALGLGERDDLCERCGMLFLFDRPGRHGFWMKGMRFSLDIAWLLDDTVVHIERHVPWDTKETYRPDTAADRVLEFRAGTLDDISVGEKVRFSFL